MAFADHLLPGASSEQEAREARAYDFGRMTQRVPAAVATPRSVEELARLVRRAASDGVRLAIRGRGHSQGGQSLIGRGISLDTRHLDRVRLIGRDIVRAQGGASWGSVVDALRSERRLPRVLADTGGVTVGGTLSAGGIGTTSHRYGAQVGQVEKLEVVTGNGERLRCSASENRGLFDAVRGGQGQFGVITEAWIRLRSAGRRFRQFELHYRDRDRFASDLEQVVDSGRFDHLRAELRLHEGEIVLNAGIEYDEKPDDGELLAGLGHDENAFTRDTASVGRAGMYPSWGFSWLHYHPWRDWILPWESLPTLIAQPWLDSNSIPPRPWSWTGMYAIADEGASAPLFLKPSGSRAISYSVLCVMGEFQYEEAVRFADKLSEIDRTLVALGGKSYLSGAANYGPEAWSDHYGEMLGKAIAWKREFDPHQVFHSAGMPFGDPLAPPADGLE